MPKTSDDIYTAPPTVLDDRAYLLVSEPDVSPVTVPREPSIAVTVHNSGKQPVYDVRVHWIDSSFDVQAGAEDKLGTIAPLNKCTARRILPAGSTESPLIPVAYFRDAAGVRWTMLDNGKFDEVDPTHPAGARSSRRQSSQGPGRERKKAALLGTALTAAATTT
jgi:hypothetical protein